MDYENASDFIEVTLLKRYNDVLVDYQNILYYFGDVFDITGGFCIDEQYKVLLFNPTKPTAKKIIIDLIRYGFQMGKFWKTDDNEYSIHDFIFLNKIYNKYILN